jgi:hypothetical protein
MQRFDARNHLFVWVSIRIFNASDLIFESPFRTPGPPAAGRNRKSFLADCCPLDLAH